MNELKPYYITPTNGKIRPAAIIASSLAKLEDLMHDAPTERDREAIRKCINQMHDM